ncbi:MAG: hypothetical protein IPO75_00850 [Betaproteobacteria bacterium]|nr:hypothetical protein [Betaproteobacteria bacterium]
MSTAATGSSSTSACRFSSLSTHSVNSSSRSPKASASIGKIQSRASGAS